MKSRLLGETVWVQLEWREYVDINDPFLVRYVEDPARIVGIVSVPRSGSHLVVQHDQLSVTVTPSMVIDSIQVTIWDAPHHGNQMAVVDVGVDASTLPADTISIRDLIIHV